MKEGEIAELVKQKPTGALNAHRIGFLYGWLLKRKTNLPAAKKVSYVDAPISISNMRAPGKIRRGVAPAITCR